MREKFFRRRARRVLKYRLSSRFCQQMICLLEDGSLMSNISFDSLHEYDPGKPGITIPVELKSGQQSVKASAKLDTGSTFCVFKREIGEQLGFDIETGVEELISSVTGSFTAYGHPLTLKAFGIELDVTVYFAK